MKSIRRFGTSDIIIPLLIFVSSFLNGGEHYAVKYLLPLMGIIFILKEKKFLLQRSHFVFIFFLIFSFVFTVLTGMANTDTVNFLLWGLFLAYVTTKAPSKAFLTQGLIVTSLLHTGILIFQWIERGALRQPSTFVNANWAAVWIAAGLYAALFMWEAAGPRLRGAVSFLLAAGVFITLSRTGFLLLFMMSLIMARRLGKRGRTAVLLLLLFAVLLFALRFSRDVKDPLAFSRGKIYDAAGKMFLQKPVLGYGAAVVDDRLPHYFLGEERTYSRYSLFPRMAHSVYLESLLSFGLFGTLILGYAIYGFYKRSGYRALFLLLLFAGIFNNIEKSFSLLLLGALFLTVPTTFKREEKESYAFAVTWKRALLPVFLISYYFLLTLLSHFFFLSGEKAMTERRLLDSFRYFYRSYRILPLDPLAAEGAVRSLLATDQIQWDVKLALCEEILSSSAALNRQNPKIYWLQGVYYQALLNSTGLTPLKPEAHARAMQSVEQALALHGNNPRYLFLKMALLAYTTDEESFEKTFYDLISLEPYYRNAYELMMQRTSNEELKNFCTQRIEVINNIPCSEPLNTYEKNILGFNGSLD